MLLFYSRLDLRSQSSSGKAWITVRPDPEMTASMHSHKRAAPAPAAVTIVLLGVVSWIARSTLERAVSIASMIEEAYRT